MKKLLILFLFIQPGAGFAQEPVRMDKSPATSGPGLEKFQESLLKPLIKKQYAAKTDSEKAAAAKELTDQFEACLQTSGSFDLDYDSLKKDIQLLRSPDNTFRIINWDVQKSDGTYEYYGFIQSKFIQITKHGMFRKTRIETMQLYPLIDRSTEIKNPDNAITDNKKWFGMWYYKIIPSKTKTRTYYTLLGWDGNDKYSQKKIIDVLSFDNNGVPHFGADIFNFQKKYPKRIIFEYSATCNMSLKYSNQKDSIVFGHLAPIEPQLEGQYQYYCSDMSNDGFGFKKGKWNYGADVNAVNDKDEKDKIYHDPRKPMAGNESNTIITRQKRKKKDK